MPSRSPEGVETQKRLPVQVLETQAKLVDTVSLCVPGGNSAWKGEWEKRQNRETSLSRNWSNSLFFRAAFIPQVVHRDKWRIQSHAGSVVLTFVEIRHFFIHTYKGLRWFYIIWLRGLPTFYEPFCLITVSQPENLFSPEVIFLKPGTTLRRHQIKLHSYRANVQWAIIKKRIY